MSTFPAFSDPAVGLGQCAIRCAHCLAAKVRQFTLPGGYWWRLYFLRTPRCRRCFRTDCPSAEWCQNECTFPADTANRMTRILPEPPITPPPPDR